MKSIALLLTVLFSLLACGEKVDSPFGTETQTDITAFNQRTLDNLIERKPPPGGVIRIGLVSDSHHNYADFDAVTKRLNAEELDFVIHLGDFSDLGLASEYDAFLDHLMKLRHLVFVLPGNHDTVSAGRFLYGKIFGDYNFTFEYAGREFIFFNSNSLEFQNGEGYDPEWLKSELATPGPPAYLFQHVNLDSDLYFKEDQQAQFADWVSDSPKLRAIFNGHNHSFETRDFGSKKLQFIEEAKGVQYAILELGPTGDRLYWCLPDCDAGFDPR